MALLIIESGATKTEAMLLGGAQEQRKRFGPGNFHQTGEAGWGALAREICDAFQCASGNALQVLVGAAGASTEFERRKISSVFTKIIPSIVSINVYNDAEFALHALDSDGMIVIVGTGSLCLGSSQGRFARTGGWGWILGDEASAAGLGLQGLRAAFRSYDGTGPKSALESEAQRQFKVAELPEILKNIYATPFPKAEVAEFSRSVLKFAKHGDQVAAQIVSESVLVLNTMIQGVKRALPDLPDTIGLCGGIFENPLTAKLILEPLQVQLRKRGSTPQFLPLWTVGQENRLFNRFAEQFRQRGTVRGVL